MKKIRTLVSLVGLTALAIVSGTGIVAYNSYRAKYAKYSNDPDKYEKIKFDLFKKKEKDLEEYYRHPNRLYSLLEESDNIFKEELERENQSRIDARFSVQNSFGQIDKALFINYLQGDKEFLKGCLEKGYWHDSVILADRIQINKSKIEILLEKSQHLPLGLFQSSDWHDPINKKLISAYMKKRWVWGAIQHLKKISNLQKPKEVLLQYGDTKENIFKTTKSRNAEFLNEITEVYEAKKPLSLPTEWPISYERLKKENEAIWQIISRTKPNI